MLGRTRTTTLIIAALVATPLAVGTAAHAAPLSAPPLVFTSDRDGDSEIYLRAADGTVRQLTRNSADDFGAVWSPDGRRLAFVSDRDGDPEVFVMGADGTGVRQLTRNRTATGGAPAVDSSPAWSPKGYQLVFTSTRDGGEPEIYKMQADGRRQVRLTRTPAHVSDHTPSWSPDGKHVVFASDRAGFDNYEVFRMRANGTGVTRLTRTPAGVDDNAPEYSPDGRRIAFSSTRNGGQQDLFTMAPDGSDVRRLGGEATLDDVFPHWTPTASGCCSTPSPDRRGSRARTSGWSARTARTAAGWWLTRPTTSRRTRGPAADSYGGAGREVTGPAADLDSRAGSTVGHRGRRRAAWSSRMRRAAAAMSSCCHTTTGSHPAARSCRSVSASRPRWSRTSPPPLRIGLRGVEVLGAPVPEAPVHVDRDAAPPQHDVRPSSAGRAGRRCIDQEAQAEPVQRTSQGELRRRVPPAVALQHPSHRLAAGRRRWWQEHRPPRARRVLTRGHHSDSQQLTGAAERRAGPADGRSSRRVHELRAAAARRGTRCRTSHGQRPRWSAQAGCSAGTAPP
jgi:TolB protein